ncbi:MAG: iron ABC transporter permease [Lentisphaeria bacterium]|nr:iron ABC transporter permease [Lentisphaeria bacterium]
MTRKKSTESFLLWLPMVLLPVLLILGICAGSFWVPVSEWRQETGLNPVVELRLIRMLAALITGASLGLSGLVFQAVLRNPLAEPFILGVSGGAGVGAALVIVCGLGAWSALSLPLGALAGSLAALGLVLSISRRGCTGSENLLLSGVITGTVAGSILMFLISIAHTDQLAGITWWMLGDLQTADPALLAPCGIVLLTALMLIWFYSRSINALSIGSSEAWNLGVNTRKLTLILIIAASLLAAFSVSLAGIIGFCGLIVPHLVRRIYGCDHRKITPLVFLWGADFLMACDLISRLPYPFKEIPVGVITSLIGGPLFLWIINRRIQYEN